MRQVSFAVAALVVGTILLAPAAEVSGIELTNVTFPERKNVKLDFARTAQAPGATLEAKVESREGQAKVEIQFSGLKPAVLFGGDVTCYVVWAVSLDGTAENLGELWSDKPKGKLQLVSIQKSFALMVTAESFYLVDRPSSLVMFTSGAHKSKKVPSLPFPFSAFEPAPAVDLESIAHIAWDSETPPLLLQAEKAYELAQRNGGDDYYPNLLYQAEVALGQARAFARSSSRKNLADYSRRSVARSSEVLQMTLRKKQAEELERQIAERRAEMEGLAQRAAEAEEAQTLAVAAHQEAEAQRLAAEAAVLEAQAEVGALGQESTRLAAERDTLQVSLSTMEAGIVGLRAETARLEADRDEMSGRLDEALSHVAETRSSARGVIVNLPDILFDVDKATLKQEANLVLAKLSGILLILEELNMRVEGHTDSTGSAAHNQGLSERRAESVTGFLAGQGIEGQRMQAVGYGLTRPIADNGTAEGRRKNRRVEIVIAEGEIGEEQVEATP